MNLLKVTVRAKFSNYIYFFYRFSKVCEVQLNPSTSNSVISNSSLFLCRPSELLLGLVVFLSCLRTVFENH